jgi:hypothetical protein
LLSTARLSSYLGVSAQDTYLAILESNAVSDVERMTGLYLGPPSTIVEVLDGPGAFPLARLSPVGAGAAIQSVRLRNALPAISAITKVEERSSLVSEWEEVALETDDEPPRDVFELDGQRLVRSVGAWPIGPRTVRVTYTYGYGTDQAPREWESVVFDLVAHRYKDPTSRQLGGGVSEASIRGVSVKFTDPAATAAGNGHGLPPDLYRRILALRPAGSF